MRTAFVFHVTDAVGFRSKMLNWLSRFNIFCLLDNPGNSGGSNRFEWMAAVDSIEILEASAGKAFQQLKAFSNQHHDWLFGHFSYDLKNETEQLRSAHPNETGFADLCFFIPRWVICINKNRLTIECSTEEEANNAFIEIGATTPDQYSQPLPRFSGIQLRYSKQDYLDAVAHIQNHIQRGDCYELNFCQEFVLNANVAAPVSLYNRLLALSPNPFAALYRINQSWCLCASPERYLALNGNRLYSQPIKGTSTRFPDDPVRDQKSKNRLLLSEKERSENVMVVDLVRNDLSRICQRGSVQVEELFGLYSFPQVHQMISTISGFLPNEVHWTDAVAATFPMGSMTGVPKKRVMELIERYERSRRGLFSGAVGYVRPSGANGQREFDFNVIIRSLFYNETAQRISFQAGSAITAASVPEEEYSECLLKINAICRVLGLDELSV